MSVSVGDTVRRSLAGGGGQGGYPHYLSLHNNNETDVIKKFLAAVISFSEGISECAGAGVKMNVLTLLAGNTSVPEFLRQLQIITNFPVRPYVLPFLQTNIPKLREELKRYVASCHAASMRMAYVYTVNLVKMWETHIGYTRYSLKQNICC